MPATRRRDVAEAILGLGYIEMMELGDALAASVANDAEEQITFDSTNRDQWCDRLRWWAEGYLDALDDES